MWRAVEAADIPALQAHLQRHLNTSMFLLGNLEAYGLDGEGDHACRYWCLGTPQAGVFACSGAGMVLMQAPEASAEDWRSAAALLMGRTVAGVVGEAAQVAGFRAACGWDVVSNLVQDEPGYDLDLSALVMPGDLGALPQSTDGDSPGGILEAKKGWDLQPLAALDAALAVDWREAYVLETGMAAPHRARAQAEREVAAYVARDTHRVLLRDGVPVGVTGLNTRAGDAVQVGGVWTPPALRGQGIARRAVALHLAEARAGGARRSVLFAANAQAARAYEAIGFQRSFTFGWWLFADPCEVAA